MRLGDRLKKLVVSTGGPQHSASVFRFITPWMNSGGNVAMPLRHASHEIDKLAAHAIKRPVNGAGPGQSLEIVGNRLSV